MTDANSAARDKKFAVTKPTNKINMATKIAGNSRKSRAICSCRPATPSTLIPIRMNPDHVTQNKDRLRSSVIDGNAAIRRKREAPASSDRRSSRVTCSSARRTVFRTYATSNPTNTITSITKSRGKNSASMCTKFWYACWSPWIITSFMTSPQLFALPPLD